jgi:serine/threonine protein kinase
MRPRTIRLLLYRIVVGARTEGCFSNSASGRAGAGHPFPLAPNDPDRLARFEREAQVLAALNHPNIAQIYGFEEASPEATVWRRCACS